MSLRDLLYRCPACGHDPTTGEGSQVRCPGCGTTFRPGSGGTRILVIASGGEAGEVPAQVLTARIEAAGGAAADEALAPDGEEVRRARVRVRRSGGEGRPVWRSGELLGFVERFGPWEEGTLVAAHDRIRLEAGEDSPEWGLLELTAVQGSSSTVQLRAASGELMQVRFIEDSPRRWESLIRRLVARCWERAGLGEVTEFQPRITAR